MTLTADDVVAIQQLYAAYNHRIDFGSAEEWADCFTPDAVFDSGYSVEKGREALLAFHGTTRAMVPGIRHFATNILIDGDDDTATGSAYLEATTGFGADRTPIATGRYDDSLVRTDEGWRFVRRVMRPDG